MCDPVTATVVAGALGFVGQQQAASKAAGAQDKATQQATAAATQTAADNKAAATAAATVADEANNRANGKQPDVAGMMGKNALDAKGGISGTMLTGPQGISPDSLLLGRTTLLGG